MKKKRENFLEKLLQQKRHPIRPKLVSALLSLCLLLASLPVEFYGFQVRAEGQEYKILSFSELPEEVRSQNVEPGTPLEELNLPKTLEAVCVPLQYEEPEPGERQEQAEMNTETKGTDLDGQGEMEGLFSDAKRSQEEEGESLPPVTERNQEEGGELPASDAEERPEEEMGTSASDGEIKPEEEMETPVSGGETEPEEELETPASGGETEPEEELELPASGGETEPEPEGGIQTPAPGAEGDLVEQPPQEPGETPQEQPETGSAAEETVAIEHIAWNSVFAYDSEKEGTYVFVPVLPEGYVLGDGVSLPEIQIAVEGEESQKEEKEGKSAAGEGKRNRRKAAEELEEEYGSWGKERALADSDSEVISVDTVWDTSKTLFGGELVIEEGATLTLNDRLTIRGIVTIRGGGTIARGKSGAGIVVEENGFLTVQDMIVDGKNLVASVPILDINKGKLAMKGSAVQNCRATLPNMKRGGIVRCSGGTLIAEDGCVIQNCSSGRGGEIGIVDGGTAYLRNSRIERCSSDSQDSVGAIYCDRSAVTLEDGCVIRDCTAVDGAAIYGFFSTVTLQNGCVIQDCTAEDGAAIGLWSDSTGNLKDVRIERCSAKRYGGAIGCYYGSELIMEAGCVIRDCDSAEGGAICLKSAKMMSMRDCTIENCDGSLGGAVSMTGRSSANLKNCKIKDCKGFCGGAIYCEKKGTVTMEEGCVIEGCTIRSANGQGGALCLVDSTADIRDCKIKGCSADSNGKGGGICCADSNVSLKDCKVEGCTATTGGAVFISKHETEDGHFAVYDNVKFGGGQTTSNKDSVYLQTIPYGGYTFISDIEVGTDLSYPVPVYLEGREGYVIAEGTGGHQLTIEDLKKLFVVDVNGNKWYKKLDTDQNQIYLTLTDPEYYFRVFYYDVDGKVTDDMKYSSGEIAAIRSVKDFASPIPNQERFLGWSKKQGADKVDYTGGENVEITEDIHLYPVYEKRKFSADFYSGGPDLSAPVHQEREAGEDVDKITINAPVLKDFEGWTPKGWSEDPEEYGSGSIILRGGACTLTEDTKNYYGVYQKEVTLSYASADKEIHVSVPKVKKFCYANVHAAITYQKAKITLAEGPKVFGYTFQGWSEQADGGGTLQKAGTEFSIQEDTTLYAVYQEKDKRTFTANFYSGSPVQKETETVTLYEPADKGEVTAPSLKDFSDWKPLGWNRSNKAYEASIGADEECTLTEDVTEFCGIYEKDITLTYKGNGGKPDLEAETNQSYANVHKEDSDDGGVSYIIPEFILTGEIQREKYILAGWSRDQDSTEAEYKVGSKQRFDKDTILYAVWKEIPPEEAVWKMEYYCQNLKGDGYDKVEADTETLTGKIGTEAEIREKTYPGFNVNLSHPDGKRKGIIEADGSLVLKLYYDRNIYEVDFDLNESDGIAPASQTVRYGDKAKEPEAPERTGYRFKGWYKDKGGTEGGPWNFSRPVEENTKTLYNTLYAVWEKIIPDPDDPDPDKPDPDNPDPDKPDPDNPDPDNPDPDNPDPDKPDPDNPDPDNPDPDNPDPDKPDPGNPDPDNPDPDNPGPDEPDPDKPDPDNPGPDDPGADPGNPGADPDNPGPKPDNPGTDPDSPDPESPAAVSYQVEHYCQNLTGDEYTRIDADTEALTGEPGTEAVAQGKTYPGFTLNLSHPLGKPKGTIVKDGSLVLKLYYDRILYEVDFNLNGGRGTQPEAQKIRYGGLLKQAPQPTRTGYYFKGWQIGEEPEGDLWDFESPVEYNTGTLHTTLYAKWADELAPILGEAAFTEGSRNFLDWLLQKESMVITVPVTEEGSGLAKAEYLLLAEDGAEKEGEAWFDEVRSISPAAAAYGSGAAVLRRVQAEGERGKYNARIAIEEEFKGKVYLTCTDHAGNRSAQKILTAKGGGVIVEENAPEIYFSNTGESAGGKPLKVKVQVKDDMEGHVSGGISCIIYHVDGGKKKSLPDEEFAQKLVEEYEFAVKIKGEGAHTLRVEARDHGGNESAAEVALRIQEKKDAPVQTPVPKDPQTPGRNGTPLGAEPKTGEGSQVKIFATLAMIAGFGYLLLYFEGENGITEQEKEEIIYRLVAWAKKGGSLRRLFGLAAIFLFLMYYHSIGKSVDVEWKEIRMNETR